jgi:hypothetical protein
MASKVQNGQYVPVAKGGGLYTTALYDSSKAATTMGAATYSTPGTAPVPFKKAPQERHHLQYAMPKSKSKRGSTRGMSDSQKVERRYVNTYRREPWNGMTLSTVIRFLNVLTHTCLLLENYFGQ